MNERRAATLRATELAAWVLAERVEVYLADVRREIARVEERNERIEVMPVGRQRVGRRAALDLEVREVPGDGVARSKGRHRRRGRLGGHALAC